MNHVKHIALHQLHKIMLFLATSYDPFKAAFNMPPSSQGLEQYPWFWLIMITAVVVVEL